MPSAVSPPQVIEVTADNYSEFRQYRYYGKPLINDRYKEGSIAAAGLADFIRIFQSTFGSAPSQWYSLRVFDVNNRVVMTSGTPINVDNLPESVRKWHGNDVEHQPVPSVLTPPPSPDKPLVIIGPGERRMGPEPAPPIQTSTSKAYEGRLLDEIMKKVSVREG